MKIVAVSDTHTFEKDIVIPDGDVLIHAGDATIAGTYDEVKTFANWLHSQPHKHKIFVAGNHDWLFQREPSIARSLFVGVAHYLQDSSVEIEGVKFYGSPWQPEFCNWAFNLPRGLPLAKKWDLIPRDTDVLITHGPPYSVLDQSHPKGEELGCGELLNAVVWVRPQVHVFGHIHGGYGTHKDGTLFVNASICDEAYHPVNAPIVFEVKAKQKAQAA